MKQYLELAKKILTEGHKKEDRTGTGTISLFGAQMKFSLADGFPVVTTKKLYLNGIIHELLWFLKGDTNIQYLVQNHVHIWDDWAFEKWIEAGSYDGNLDVTDWKKRMKEDEEYRKELKKEMNRFAKRIAEDDDFAKKWGNLGYIYGQQWRSCQGYDGKIYDQIQWVIDEIRRNPSSRRLIVNAWKVEDVLSNRMALPPCHVLFQFYVVDGKLSCQLYQRSADFFLGVPFNIASYALLTHMIAHVTGLKAGDFIHTIGDAHIYLNHVEQIKTQLQREPYPLPTLELNPDIKRIEDFTFDDIRIQNYQSHPKLTGIVAV